MFVGLSGESETETGKETELRKYKILSGQVKYQTNDYLLPDDSDWKWLEMNFALLCFTCFTYLIDNLIRSWSHFTEGAVIV